MKKLILRLYKRFKIRLRKLGRSSALKSYEEVELHEKTAFKICVKLISHKDSDFMIAPMSNKRYIINESLNLFIILDFGRIEITNHVFNYNIRLSQRDWQRIVYIFDTETEKRRTEMEQEVNSQIKNSLYTVLERISNFK